MQSRLTYPDAKGLLRYVPKLNLVVMFGAPELRDVQKQIEVKKAFACLASAMTHVYALVKLVSETGVVQIAAPSRPMEPGE